MFFYDSQKTLVELTERHHFSCNYFSNGFVTPRDTYTKFDFYASIQILNCLCLNTLCE